MVPGTTSKSAGATAGAQKKSSRSKLAWSDEQILAAADLLVPAQNITAGYRFGLSLLAAALVAVPVIYLALIAFLGWLFLWHADQTFSSLSLGPFFIFHIPMAILGAVLIVFLVKPVFFRAKRKDQGIITLTPATQSLLFKFVEKTCESVGAVAPAVIEVDCQPNAHVAMRRGLISVVGGDLVLRIGLPLVAAFSLQQLAGVLAHEFGHFNQLAGRNSSYLIRRLTNFFAKVVFQRDKLDARLLNLRARRRMVPKLIYYLIAGPIESVRGLLWLMLISSDLITCRAMRHMEYDADLLEAQISGVEDFVRVSKLLAFLGIAAHRARRDLDGAMDQLRLADDLPRLIVVSAKQLVEHRTDILKSLDEGRTRWFDTHPSHNDRVRNVRDAGATGLLQCTEPARRLFVDFDGLCKSATTAFYRSVLGEKIEAIKLVPADELAAETAGQRKSMKSLRRYFQDQLIISRPIIPSVAADLPITDANAVIAELRTARNDMASFAAELIDLPRQFRSAELNLCLANATLDLCALFPGNPRIYPLRLKAVKDKNRSEKIIADARPRFLNFEQSAHLRLNAALRLLRDDRVVARIPPGPSNVETARPEFVGLLVGVLREMQPHLQSVERLRSAAIGLRAHLSAINLKRQFPPLSKKIIGMSGDMVRKLTKLKSDLELVPYPFEHGLNVGAIGDVLVQDLPDMTNPYQTCNAAERVVARFDVLMVRMFGSLSEWAEKVELTVGLEPLPEPPDKEDERDIERQVKQRRNTRRYWIAYGSRASGGLVLLSCLIWLSVSPPALHGSGDQSGVSYRPAAFTASTSFQPAQPQVRLLDSGWISVNNAEMVQRLQAMQSQHQWAPPLISPRNWSQSELNSNRPDWQPQHMPVPMQIPEMPQFQTSQPNFSRSPQFAPRPFTPPMEGQHPVGPPPHR